jgi:hypothetical protein
MKRQLLFVGIIWLLTIGRAGAQYDLHRLTSLYHTALELRTLTEKTMTDAIVLTREIQPYRAVSHLNEDTDRLEMLVGHLEADTPRDMQDLVRTVRRIEKVLVPWLMEIKNPEPGRRFARVAAKGYKKLAAEEAFYLHTLKKYLGMDDETLADLDRVMQFYIDTQRGFVSYLLKDDPVRSVYGPAMDLKGDGTALFDKALKQVRKLMSRYVDEPSLRKALKNIYADLMFFHEAVQRGYRPEVFYISFEKFDDKYRRFLQLFFEKNKWI